MHIKAADDFLADGAASATLPESLPAAVLETESKDTLWPFVPGGRGVEERKLTYI